MGVQEALSAVYEELVKDTARDCVELVAARAGDADGGSRQVALGGAEESVRDRIDDVRSGVLAIILGAWRKPLLARALAGHAQGWQSELGLVAEMDWNFTRRVRQLIEDGVHELERQGRFAAESSDDDLDYENFDWFLPGAEESSSLEEWEV